MNAVAHSSLFNEFENIGEQEAISTGTKHWGVCYDYALEQFGFDKDTWCGRGCWRAFCYIQENFIQIPFNMAEKGDMVVYHDRERKDRYRNDPDFDIWGEIEHFGIVLEPNKQYEKIIVKSQWGWTRLYIHEVGAVPSIYGNAVTFWRHKDNKKAIETKGIKDEDSI